MLRFVFAALAAYFALSYSVALSQNLPAGISPAMIEQAKRMAPSQQKALAAEFGFDLSAPHSSAEPKSKNLVTKAREENSPEIQVSTASVQKKSSRIFGANLFSRTVSTFAPVDNAPVPDDYRIGPGDQLVVQIFGGENETLYLDVSRDGLINFPNLGPINLMGLSFSEARGMLQKKITEEFVGLSSVITLGNMRAINVFMAGEISVPGAYSISALSTITQALFSAGGVNGLGSLRDIQVRRNNQVVASFDLYDLLMRGDASKDIRLNSGDVLFVPPHAGLVDIRGAVKRPFIFELKEGETLADLVRFAGGFKENAYKSTLQLERVAREDELPTVLTLSYNEKASSRLRPGDRVIVPESSDYLYNAITIRGSVVRPGNYEWRKGIRVSDLIFDARSMLRITTDMSYSLIVRTINDKLDIEVLQFDLGAVLTNPGKADDIVLQPRDEILVFDRSDLNTTDDKDVEGLSGEGIADAGNAQRSVLLAPVIAKLQRQARFAENIQTVSVSGAVKSPGIYPLSRGLEINSLVEAAGGFEDFAHRESAEYRELMLSNDGEMEIKYRDIDLSIDQSAQILKSRDHLFVRTVSDWNPLDEITISGEVKFPGSYLVKKGETLSKVIERAGGLTEEAFVRGAVYTRQSIRDAELRRAKEFSRSLEKSYAASLLTQEDAKALDFAMLQQIGEAISKPEAMGRLVIDLAGIVEGKNSSDVRVLNGDNLYIPKSVDTISIMGEVNLSRSQTYSEDFTINDYVKLAAGYTSRADKSGVYVVSADGTVTSRETNFFGFSRALKLVPGDTIVVPINTTYRDTLPLWRDVTGIVYQTLISLAVLAAI